jgi:queuine tRNA-ribosyltransferase
VVQGGIYPDLRRESAEFTADRDFFGTAIGGSLGADKAQMYEVVSYCAPYIHPDRPVHLLGIGGIGDIFAGVRLGIDSFDCVVPTRVARHGWALMKGTPAERINLRNARHRADPAPIDETCGCDTCRQFSRGYLHHLIRAEELLGITLVVIHNVFTMTRLMREVREAIRAGNLDEAEAAWVGSAG